jgi:hypothetical protein
MTIQTSIIRDDTDIEVTVELSYTPAERGSRDRYGAPLEPDYPASFEVESAVDNNGKEYDLTDSEESLVINEAFETHADYINDYD